MSTQPPRTLIASEALAPAILEALGLPPDTLDTCEGINIRLEPNQPVHVSVLLLADRRIVAVPWHTLLEKPTDEC